jgi:hypothetical protein
VGVVGARGVEVWVPKGYQKNLLAHLKLRIK